MKKQVLTVALVGMAVLAAVAPSPAAAQGSSAVWSGAFVGLQGGYGQALTSYGWGGSNRARGLVGGAYGGFNWQTGNIVFGADASLDRLGMKGTTICAGGLASCMSETAWQGDGRLRLGLALDRMLVYGAGGFAVASLTTSIPDSIDGAFGGRTDTRVGWTLGGGIETAVTDNWVVGIDYKHADFGKGDATYSVLNGNSFATITAATKIGLTTDLIQARFSFKF